MKYSAYCVAIGAGGGGGGGGGGGPLGGACPNCAARRPFDVAVDVTKTMASLGISRQDAELRVLCCDEEGEVVRGKGFWASRVSTGEYELSFHQPFLAPPVVVVAAQTYAVCYLPVAGIGESSVRIKVRV